MTKADFQPLALGDIIAADYQSFAKGDMILRRGDITGLDYQSLKKLLEPFCDGN